MKLTDFDFLLPETRIAYRPLQDRHKSKLLVLHRDGVCEHKCFHDLPSYIESGDLLLINNTKVYPARLTGMKKNGGKLDILLVQKIDGNLWEVLSKGNFTGLLKVSDDFQIDLQNGKTAYLHCKDNDIMDILWKHGDMPLPPYIRRKPDNSDKQNYQTIFAEELGSIAAPTAGLHFTQTVLDTLTSKGVMVRKLTLHVGIGTFKPIRSDTIEKHTMDEEFFDIDKCIISDIRETKASGKRVFSVGTTTTRAIEGYASGQCVLKSSNGRFCGTTDIFIYPGYSFQLIDSLITNFHLPRSTPLMLASALAGWKHLKKAYEEALSRKYRFLSYGDAMLIL
jgi:S-adenosylmethionine:tRNA ribosyltransferase-isomerase